MSLKTPKVRRQQSGRVFNGIASRSIQRSRQTTINLILILVTGIIGVVAWIIGTMLYSALVDTISRVLLIGIIFAGFTLVLCIVIYIYSKATGTFEDNILTGSSGGIDVVFFIFLAVIVVFLATMLFQWIYGLNFDNQVTEPTSYIFLIDDSGSMEGNDPSQERYNAISEVLKDMPDSFEYMVYGFSNEAYIIQEMTPVSGGIPDISGSSSGGTAIRAALSRVLDDYDNGIWDGGASPKVILLTDGYATDIGVFTSVNKVLKRYVRAHINVSTVGLGNVDTGLLKKIAKTTGGVFVDVDDAAKLFEAMNSAAKEYLVRDLLSTRYQASLNFLYGFLRVLFLIILGICIGFTSAIAYGFKESISLTMITTLIKSMFGALTMELGTGLAGLSDRFMWLILWILFATTVTLKMSSYRGTSQRTLRRPNMSPNKSSRRISKY